MDLAYTTAASPLGTLVLAATPYGLVRLAYGDAGIEPALMELGARIPARVVERPAPLDDVRRQLDEYFSGERRSFDLRLDLRLLSGFARRVLAACAAIPYGAVATYRHVAAAAGNERAVRAAGTALGRNPVPIVVPCHRVVPTGGGLGGYTGGSGRKAELLRLEETSTAALIGV